MPIVAVWVLALYTTSENEYKAISTPGVDEDPGTAEAPALLTFKATVCKAQIESRKVNRLTANGV